MYCMQCGQPVEEEWFFCRNCGYQLRADPPENHSDQSDIPKRDSQQADDALRQEAPSEGEEFSFEISQTIQKWAEVCQREEYNSIVGWAMALVPVVGIPLEMLTGFGKIYLLLNVLLGYIDDYRLKKQGIDTSQFGGLAFFVLFYLYKRARLLGDHLGYFATWCLLTLVTLFI